MTAMLADISEGWECRLSHVALHWSGSYIAWLLISAILIRVVMCSVRVFTDYPRKKDIWPSLRSYFLGVKEYQFTADRQYGTTIERTFPDHWHPFILGLIELLAYPVLMASGAWSAIGAWLVFKTVAGWKDFPETRRVYNQFLIGNALNVMASFLLMLFAR